MRKGVRSLLAIGLLIGLCSCRRADQGAGAKLESREMGLQMEEQADQSQSADGHQGIWTGQEEIFQDPKTGEGQEQQMSGDLSRQTGADQSGAAQEPGGAQESAGQEMEGLRYEEPGPENADPVELSGPLYEKTPRVLGQVTLSFAGDISFAEGYANMSFYHSSGDDITRCISEDLIARMDLADIMMINNEFAYSDRGQPLSGKDFTFRAKPEMAAELERLSVDIVSLANNHVYDYGETALLDTLDTLDRYQIPRVGAGKDLEEAKEIVYFQVEGMKIAYVSATQIERSYVYTKEATETSPGVLRTYDPAVFLEVIQRAEETSDFVVVYVHWGTEGVDRFGADQRQLGYQYIDAGADLVIGDHPHRLQGIEFYKGVPIFYSLGNYWFNSSTLDTGLVEVDVSPEGIRELRFVPCLQKGCRTVLVDDPAGRQRVLSYLESISVNAQIDEAGRILETVP